MDLQPLKMRLVAHQASVELLFLPPNFRSSVLENSIQHTTLDTQSREGRCQLGIHRIEWVQG